MINDYDIIELQQAIDKFYKLLAETETRKNSSDIIKVLDGLGERLAAHFTASGIKAYYQLSPTQIISVDINMSAEKEYDNYYKKENSDDDR